MLTIKSSKKFSSLCPDFVLELLSPRDNLKQTQEKIQEYLENVCHLGALINRGKQEVEIYCLRQAVEILKFLQTLSRRNILSECRLNLQKN